MDDNTDLTGGLMIGTDAVSNKDNARKYLRILKSTKIFNLLPLTLCGTVRFFFNYVMLNELWLVFNQLLKISSNT